MAQYCEDSFCLSTKWKVTNYLTLVGIDSRQKLRNTKITCDMDSSRQYIIHFVYYMCLVRRQREDWLQHGWQLLSRYCCADNNCALTLLRTPVYSRLMQFFVSHLFTYLLTYILNTYY